MAFLYILLLVCSTFISTRSHYFVRREQREFSLSCDLHSLSSRLFGMKPISCVSWTKYDTRKDKEEKDRKNNSFVFLSFQCNECTAAGI